MNTGNQNPRTSGRGVVNLKRASSHGLIEEARAVFVAALDRQGATGATSLVANELHTLREVGQVYGDLLKEVTHKEFQAACAHTDANVQRISRQKASATTSGNEWVIERKPDHAAA